MSRPVLPEPGAFSISTTWASGAMARATSSRCRQMTMTDAECDTMRRSSALKARTRSRDRLNLKFDNCSGRLECIS